MRTTIIKETTRQALTFFAVDDAEETRNWMKRFHRTEQRFDDGSGMLSFAIPADMAMAEDFEKRARLAGVQVIEQ